MKFIIECEEIMAPVVENMMARLGDGVKLSPYVVGGNANPKRWKGKPYASGGNKPKPLVKTFTVSNDARGNLFRVSLSYNAFETRESVKARGYKWNNDGKTWEKTVPDHLVSSEIGSLTSLGIEFKG